MFSKLIVSKNLFDTKIHFYVNNNLVCQGVKKKSEYIILPLLAHMCKASYHAVA